MAYYKSMKKGQATFIMVLMVIVIILLAVIALKPKITGNIIKEETNENIEVQGTILNPYVGENKYYTGSGIINPPFYLNAWKVETTGIKIELKNTGEEPLRITKVSISNCGEVSTTSEQNIFSIPCLLSKGSVFTGDIEIEYSKIGSSVKLSSTGTITNIVE